MASRKKSRKTKLTKEQIASLGGPMYGSLEKTLAQKHEELISLSMKQLRTRIRDDLKTLIDSYMMVHAPFVLAAVLKTKNWRLDSNEVVMPNDVCRAQQKACEQSKEAASMRMDAVDDIERGVKEHVRKFLKTALENLD